MTQASPRRLARIAGLLYLLNFVTAAIWSVAFGGLVASGDAAATATNILAHEPRFLLGFATYLLMVATYLGVTALFYVLFRPVNRSLSVLAAFFSLVGCTVGAVGSVFLYAPSAVLRGAGTLSGFQPEQVRGLSLMLLELQGQTFNSSLVFFGFYCLLIGYLVYRSTFLPRPLGVLMVIAGAGWLTFLSPPLATGLSRYVLVSGAVGEGSLALWLLIKGIDVGTAAGDAGPAVADVGPAGAPAG